MTLPIRTTVADIEAICGYLVTKPTGATLAEAKAVLDTAVLDGRKLNAYKTWKFVEESANKLRITERGRLIARSNGTKKVDALRAAIKDCPPYQGAIERAKHRQELSVTASDLGAYWYDHYGDEASDSDKILNDQAVCFFQLAEGADLGQLIVGRRGQPTRFEFDAGNIDAFLEIEDSFEEPPSDQLLENTDIEEAANPGDSGVHPNQVQYCKPGNNRVFITHGKNHKILEQLKDIVAYGKFEPVVAQDRETAAKPVPDKVMDEMRECSAAVIHVSVEKVLYDKEGNEYPQLNGNVLIEIGAAMALYGKKFILLVEDGATLPSNLQGLYECRYSGDELSGAATMKLLKAFNEFA